jgi:hypothetical protein
MELPFAVESPERVSTLHVVSGAVVTGGDDDNESLHQHSSGGGSSLVTASSQGSLMNSNLLSGNSPLPPNTPQDVVLHYHDNSFHHQQQQGQQQHRHPTQHQQQQQHQQHVQPGQMMMSATAIHQQQQRGRMAAQQQQQQQQSPQLNSTEPDMNDFTYVNICETDADEVDILIEGGYTTTEPETRRGDVLTILLSGMPQQETENEELVVRVLLRDTRESACVCASVYARANKTTENTTAIKYV